MHFGLLGQLEVREGSDTIAVSGVRQQTILALMLLSANRMVPVHRMVEAVWRDRPPATSIDQIYICISSLRRRLCGSNAPVIETGRSGYALHVDDDQVDVTRFTALVATGTAHARAGRLAESVQTLRSALGLWRDAALEGLDSHLLRAPARRLDESRLAVFQDCLDLELRIGHHRRVVSELREAVELHPLHERLHLQLMVALLQSGRRAEALGVHRQIAVNLREEQGLDPGPELQAAQNAILAGDSRLEHPGPDDLPGTGALLRLPGHRTA